MDTSEEASVSAPTTILNPEKYKLSSTDIANRGMSVNDSYQNGGIPPPPYTLDDDQSCRIDMPPSRDSSQQPNQISRTRAVKCTCFLCGFLVSGTFLVATAAVMLNGGEFVDPVSHQKQTNNYTTIGPIFLGLGFTLFVVGAVLIGRVCKSVYFEGSDGRDPIIVERRVISRRPGNHDVRELSGHDNAASEFSVPHRHMDVPDLGLFVYPRENHVSGTVPPRVYQRPPGYWEQVLPPAYTEETVPVHTRASG